VEETFGFSKSTCLIGKSHYISVATTYVSVCIYFNIISNIYPWKILSKEMEPWQSNLVTRYEMMAVGLAFSRGVWMWNR
jgi:hypothetical protein